MGYVITSGAGPEVDGYNRNIHFSSTGERWLPAVLKGLENNTPIFRDIIYTGTQWVAYGDGSDAQLESCLVIATSTQGTVWDVSYIRIPPPLSYGRQIYYTGSEYLILSDTGFTGSGASYILYRSSNLIDWTRHWIYPPGANVGSAVGFYFHNGLWGINRYLSTLGSGNWGYSSNLTSWTWVDSAPGFYVARVGHAEGLYFANSRRSINGTSWSGNSSLVGWTTLINQKTAAYGNGMYLLTGGEKPWYSPDGANWVDPIGGIYSPVGRGLSFDPNWGFLYVCLSEDYDDPIVLTISLDGTTWRGLDGPPIKSGMFTSVASGPVSSGILIGKIGVG